MALQNSDPNILQIAVICQSEETAHQFAVENSLLPRVPGVGQLGNRPPCTLRPNCAGSLYSTSIKGVKSQTDYGVWVYLILNILTGRSHYVRCTICRNTKSTKNGGAFLNGNGNSTWFARVDSLNRPNVKLKTNVVLLITWCWSKGMDIRTTKTILNNGIIGQQSNNTLVDWFGYIRELLIHRMNNSEKMGGPNQIVQIDESYFRGRRKPSANRRGRLLLGTFPI